MKKVLYYFVCVAVAVFLAINSVVSCHKDSDGGGVGGGASEGKGGSMARFAIKGDYLYIVSTDSLKIFNIEDAPTPRYYHVFSAIRYF